jgi:hypothetical protein
MGDIFAAIVKAKTGETQLEITAWNGVQISGYDCSIVSEESMSGSSVSAAVIYSTAISA